MAVNELFESYGMAKARLLLHDDTTTDWRTWQAFNRLGKTQLTATLASSEAQTIAYSRYFRLTL